MILSAVRSSRQSRRGFALRLAAVGLVLMIAARSELQGAVIGFTGEYDLANFTLLNSTFANGYATVAPGGLPLVLTGPNDGSGLPGITDLFIAAPAAGLVQFSFEYSTLDPDPGFDYAGYLLNGTFYQLADTVGQTGDVTFLVDPGILFGFRVGSVDNIGEPGVLTIISFSAPESEAYIPEPGSFVLVLSALLLFGLSRRLARSRTGAGAAALLAVFGAAIGIQPLSAQIPYTSGSNITGQLVLTRVVNLRQTAQLVQMRGAIITSAERKPKTPPKHPRPYFPSSTSRSWVFAASPTPPLTFASPAGGFGFNALSHRDQRLAYQGNQFSIEPPSPSIAVGNGYVLEGVNNAVQVYTTAGLPVLPVVLASNQVFGLAPAIDWNTGINGVYTTDMRVFFDPDINRWFILQRTQDNDVLGMPLNSSHLYLAVSVAPDPAGDYYVYIMDTTNAGNPGCPCVADYPQIGADQYGFHIATNEFDTATNTWFVDVALFSISKTSLASGAALPTIYRHLIRLNNGFEFSLQPATTPPGARNLVTQGGVAYFVSTSSSAIADRLAVWALTNTSSLVTPNPAPMLMSTQVSILPYMLPDVATQRPGPTPYGSSLTPPATGVPWLDGGDNRVQSVSYAGGRLYVSFASSVTDQGGARRVGGVYVVLSPILRGSALAATVLNQSYFFVNGNHLLRPSLAVNPAGKGLIAVTLVGPDWFPSAAYIPIDTFSRPASILVAAAGALPEDGFTGYSDWGDLQIARWGDYNGAVAVEDGSIWTVTQYIGNYPRTEFANWNTYIYRKQP
jgi:hypothetical protein